MRRIAVILTAVVVLLVGLGIGTALASGHQVTCPAGTACTYSKVIVQDPDSSIMRPNPNQFLVEDKNGAPMFWVNVGGAFSGGEPVCISNLKLQPIACLGGPLGNYGGQPVVTLYHRGKPYSLTAKDITWLHSHGG